MADVTAVDVQKLNVIVDQINKVVGITIKFGEDGAKIKPPSMPDDLFDHYEVQYIMCEKADSSCEGASDPSSLDWTKADTVLFDQLDGELTITGLIPGRVYWFRARAWSVEGGVGEKWYYENYAAATLSIPAPTNASVSPVTGDPENADFGKVNFSCNYTYNSEVARIEIWNKAYDASDASIIASVPIEDFKATGSQTLTVFISEFNNQMTTIEYYFYAVDINTKYSSPAHGSGTQLTAADVAIGTLYPDSDDTKVVSDKSNFIVKLDVLDISDIFAYSRYRYKSKKVTDAGYGTYSNWVIGTDTVLLPNKDATDGTYLQYMLQYELHDKYGNVYYLDNNQSTEIAVAGVDLVPPKMVSPLNIYGPFYSENFDSYADGYYIVNAPGDWDASEANSPTIAYSYISGSTSEKDGGKCLLLHPTSGEDSWIKYLYSANTFVKFAFLFRFRFTGTGYPIISYFNLSSTEGIKITINQAGTVVFVRENGNVTLWSYTWSGGFTINNWYNMLIVSMGYDLYNDHDVGAVTAIINGTEVMPLHGTEFHDTSDSQSSDKNKIYLNSTASSSDDHYNGNYIRIIGGAGIGGEATIIDYIGSTRQAILDRDLPDFPDSTSEYYIMQKPYASVPANGNGYYKFEVDAGGANSYIDNVEIYKNDYVSGQ